VPETSSVVLVDDDAALVKLLAAAISVRLPDLVLHATSSPRQALAWVESEAPMILITDVSMPELSGIELVSAARRRMPHLPIIVITGRTLGDVERDVGDLRAISFLRKPVATDLLVQRIEATLHRSSFTGSIQVESLADVVQLYSLSRSTCVLELQTHDGTHCLWFDRGSIVHATFRGLEGERAAYAILARTGGTFAHRPNVVAPRRTIEVPVTALLMEAARRQDEGVPEASGDGEDWGWDDRTPVITIPPRPSATKPPPFRPPPRPPPLPEPAPAESPPESPSDRNPQPQDDNDMRNATEQLKTLNDIDGYVGSALVDSDSGMMLASDGGGPINLEIAAAGNTEVVRAKRKVAKSLNLKDDIEDILITLGRAYHLIRPVRAKPSVFFYLVLDRSRANLAMSRLKLADAEKNLL
jgi:DNA-binding response OmpR family regulator/predicted regulator of Ras-like GTPase activity (Roadblock/LC7/MglB family)